MKVQLSDGELREIINDNPRLSLTNDSRASQSDSDTERLYHLQTSETDSESAESDTEETDGLVSGVDAWKEGGEEYL